MKTVFLVLLSLLATISSAQASLQKSDLNQGTFVCNDGKTSFKFFPVETQAGVVGNVKRVEITSPDINGHLGYLIVWSYGVHVFEAGLNASGYYPDFKNFEAYTSVLPKFIGDIKIEENQTGAILTVAPVRAEHGAFELVCKNPSVR